MTDNEVAEFVGALLDEVESFKVTSEKLTSEQGQAILNDEDVAQAYIENFALKVFAKADKDIYNKTTTKRTVPVFIAAATFLDLLRIFQSPLEPDIADKIRYAKYQATRIVKSIKAGEDPNLYDPPAVENEEERVDDLLRSSEADAEQDSGEPLDLPSAASHDPGNAPFSLPSAASHDPSAPFSLPSAASHDPSAPFNLPSAASHDPNNAQGSGNLPSAPSFQPETLYSPSPPVARAPVVSSPRQAGATHGRHLTTQEVQSMMDESEVVATAQKHAKFAISALNYEDMETAIRELSAALDLLKAHSV